MLLLREQIQNFQIVKESVEGQTSPRRYIHGIFMQGELVNANGRMYPIDILEKAVRDYSDKFVATGRAVGELNHPDSPQINFERACIRTVDLYRDGNNIMGKALVLSSPLGKLIDGLIEDGVQVGVSSRGVASIKKDKGIDVVEDDFMICAAADVVSDPSAPDAFVNSVMENREWVFESGVWSQKVIETAQRTIKSATGRKGVERAYRQVAEGLVKALSFSVDKNSR